MWDGEVRNGFLMVLLMNRCGDYERVEEFKLQIGHRCCAIAQIDIVLAIANIRCRPLGNFPRLPFGSSIDDQNLHDGTRIAMSRRDHGESRNLLDQRDWNFGQMDNLHGD